MDREDSGVKKIMEVSVGDWREKLAGVDDDYLIGISNKGIVKRAYKDKGETAAEVRSLNGEAVVKVGEETVTICFPLGESKCTCPSRSICRHVIQAILTLREDTAGEGVTAPPEGLAAPPEGLAVPPEGVTAPPEGLAAPPEGLAVPPEGVTASPEGVTAPPEGITAPPEGITASPEGATAPPEGASLRPPASDKVCGEIAEYPVEALKKVLGNRQFRNFANQAAMDIRPRIQYASVVTVALLGREAGTENVVKLLSPLKYSTCTCHKKELCAHKAAAILWCKLDLGKLAKEELADGAAEELSYDLDRVKDVAGQMKLFLEELLGTGLSRTSPDVLDHMERLAVIGHNASLAKYEGYFRALFDSYDRYFKRNASFRTADLMEQITRLYRRVELLGKAKDSAQVRQYAGEFRAEYLPVGRLDLIGIAAEHFNSKTGYEGETVYFLEENTKKWYTYTNARPVFYETGKKRRFTEKAQAPWGLGISLEELLNVRICLRGAKCDERGRLSASQETRGEITGEQRLSLSDIEGWYYKDFGKLFLEQIGKRQKGWLARDGSPEAAELVFVQPAACEPADFSQSEQQLSLPLYDGEEREVIVEVTYSKEESATIRYLERISERKLPCFVGKIYLRDGRLRMYPVAVQEQFSQ